MIVTAREARALDDAALDRARSQLLDALPEAAWLVEARKLRIVAANPASGRLFGEPAVLTVGRRVLDLCATPEDLCFWTEVAAGRGNGSIVSDTLVLRSDGMTVPVTRSVRPVGGPVHGRPTGFLVAFHDLSERRHAERDAEMLVADLQATLESTADALLVTDLDGRVRFCNARFATLWNLSDELLMRRDDAALDDRMRRAVVDPAGYVERLADLRRSPLTHASDLLQLRSGQVIERVTQPQLGRGLPIGRVYSFRDITERVEATRRIEHMSRTDTLTGLPNRRLLDERIGFALALARREAGTFALMFLDLDRFKHINDSLGHGVGDQVLIDASLRIKGCLREVDTVARLGGDEFVMLVHQADAASAEATARRVLEAMAEPFMHGELRFTMTCSIGIALYPADGADVDDLMRHADAAMYGVKGDGRAGFRFHHAHRTVDLLPRMRLDHAMRQALAHGRFRLAFQPQHHVASGRVVGAEALLRWNEPGLGELAPADFIPVAEESGFIVPLGAWVLGEAVRQAAAWHAEGRGLCVAVNVSALQFRQPGFVAGIAETLARWRLPPQLLEIELTESILIQDADEALGRLHELAALGVRLTIDDFGTGYSSLGYLKRFPIQRLKIDRSFVDGLPADGSNAAIVHAIVQLARALGLEVIAEGVETEAQRAFLEAAGCALYQGFLAAPAGDALSFPPHQPHAG